jgi:predicted CXXCH cytochrome family protein
MGFLVLLANLLFLLVSQTRAQEQSGHPFIEPKEIKSETCLTCHPDKKGGKFVHTAVGMGCENCHQATSDKEKQTTRIELVATGGDLCAVCHEAKKDPVLHGPYKNGECLTCHDPHTSEHPKQLRAEVNSLCLECHAERRRVEGPVGLFGDKAKISQADFEQIPKIVPNAAVKMGHPFARHPMAEVPDPLRGGEKMSCLSCHEAHSSQAGPLIRIAKTKNGDICAACHEAFEAKQSAENQKKYGATEQKNRKEAQERLKKQNDERPAEPKKTGDQP